MKRTLRALATGVLALGIGSTAIAADKPTLKIAYVNGWDDSVATTHVAANIIEKQLGYPVTLQPLEPAIMWQGVSRGDLDATLSAWMPVTHGEYYERLKDKVEIVGTHYKEARIGLVVPDYVKATRIEDLNALSKELDGKITGIDAGAGIMRRTEDAIKDYNLDLRLQPSSGPAMTTALSRAIRDEKPIVVTSWIPHWMFAQWKLRFLEDSKGSFGESERIDSVINPSLNQKAPEVVAFLKHFTWGPEDVGSVMLDIREGAKPDAAAEKWVKANGAKVQEWLK